MNVEFYPLVVKRDWAWVKMNLPVTLMENTKGIIGVNRDTEERVCVCVFDSWTHSAVQAHIYIQTPMVIRHGFLDEVAEYVFNTCGKTVMVGLVPESFPWALKFDKNIGFREVARITDGFDVGVDYVVLEMRREDGARWLKQEVLDEQRSA